MDRISLHEAQANLPELIQQLLPGDELIIMEANDPVARLIRSARPLQKPRQPGTLKGSVLFMAPDFDIPLDDFIE